MQTNPTRPLSLELLGIREFNTTDWLPDEYWRWDNGDNPVIREFPGGFNIVVDAVNVLLFVPDNGVYVLQLAFPTQLAAVAFLAGLPNEFEPTDYGFRTFITQ